MGLSNRLKISRTLRWILILGGLAIVAVGLFINYRFNLPAGTAC